MIEEFLKTYKDGFEVMLNPKERDEIVEEIERLNKGYCKFKEECGKYADCSRETYSKEIERLNKRIDKAIEYNKEVLTWYTNEEITDEIANENIRLLKGEDKE